MATRVNESKYEPLPPPDMDLTHLAPTIGTEVRGIDLRQDLPDATIAYLRKLLLERRAVLFLDQDLSGDDHRRVARYFGPQSRTPRGLPYGQGSEEDASSSIHRFARGAGNTARENYWHQDQSNANPPVAGKVAIVRTLPDRGGDTVFADMAAAYDGLSPWLQRAVQDMWSLQGYNPKVQEYHPDLSDEDLGRWAALYPARAMPVVQVHPETGRKILYVSRTFTISILGVPRDESQMLIDHLSKQAFVPEYQCRFRWRAGAVGMWDNRSVQHYACFDYPGHERALEGVFFMSEQPWPGVA
jgi:taurine dioxygenase